MVDGWLMLISKGVVKLPALLGIMISLFFSWESPSIRRTSLEEVECVASTYWFVQKHFLKSNGSWFIIVPWKLQRIGVSWANHPSYNSSIPSDVDKSHMLVKSPLLVHEKSTFFAGKHRLGLHPEILGKSEKPRVFPIEERGFLQVFPSFLAAGSSFAVLGLCLAVSECCQVRDQPKQLVDYEYGILWDLAINNRDLMGFNGI